jgi:signal transduction histidine kinase
VQLSAKEFSPSSNSRLLLAYIADLELEVDRLRKQSQFVRHEAREMLGRIRSICGSDDSADSANATLADIAQATEQFAAVLRDVNDPPGYHPARDQVIAIAVRPIIEQVFRWQQRLHGASHASLHIELASESIDWFPARFRHVVDNLISNALKYRDPEKGEARVMVSLNRLAEAIELRVSDNGVGMPWNTRTETFELFYRSIPAGATGLGVGLAVVKLLVEQSGGSLTVQSSEGQGTSFVVLLPRYDAGDYLS